MGAMAKRVIKGFVLVMMVVVLTILVHVVALANNPSVRVLETGLGEQKKVG
jgi:hypothetical protein